MSELSDEELRNQLASYGFKAGPIDGTTRKVYLKKLEMLKINNPKSTSTMKNSPMKPATQIKKPVRSNSIGRDSKPTAPVAVRDTVAEKKSVETISAPVPRIEPKISKSYFTLSESEESECDESPRDKSFEYLPKSPLSRKSVTNLFNDSAKSIGISAQSSLLFTPERNPVARKSRLSCFSRLSSTRKPITSDEETNKYRYDRDTVEPSENPHSNLSEEKFGAFLNHLKLILFAVVISGVLYFMINNLSEKSSPEFKPYEISHLICPQDQLSLDSNQKCIPYTISNEVTAAFKNLIHVMGKYSGCYYCKVPFNDHSLPPSGPELQIDVAKSLVVGYLGANEKMNSIWDSLILILRNFGPERSGIKINFANGRMASLVSLVPKYSLLCRLNFIYEWLANWVWYITVVATVTISLAIIVYTFVSWRRSVRESQARLEAKIQEIIASTIDILQRTQMESEKSSGNVTGNVPIEKLRIKVAAKIPETNDLWDEVCKRIREKENCIVEECLRGLGDTWRWRSGVGWQGSALSDASVSSGKISKAPSECLKIRNMFITDGYLSSGQENRIKHQLFKKISHCGGICHIGVSGQDHSLDRSTSSQFGNQSKNSGIVYILCMSLDVAANVYNSINAHYFDSRLVIAKFITLDRYYNRFPEATNALRALNEQDFS